jgi:hypothetical protein
VLLALQLRRLQHPALRVSHRSQLLQKMRIAWLLLLLALVRLVVKLLVLAALTLQVPVVLA